MAREIIGDEGVILEDDEDTFVLSSGVFAEDQAAAAAGVLNLVMAPYLPAQR